MSKRKEEEDHSCSATRSSFPDGEIPQIRSCIFFFDLLENSIRSNELPCAMFQLPPLPNFKKFLMYFV